MPSPAHMEHFHAATIVLGDQTVMEHVDGILACREKASHRQEWHGYFETTQAVPIEPGLHYQLRLADGRQAEIHAGEIRQADPTGVRMHVVEFYVVGELRHTGSRYALDRQATAHRYW